MSDIDCLVSASAVGVQPIPCTAALIHERVAKGTPTFLLWISIPLVPVLYLLHAVSYLIEGGEYRRVLIVSGK